MWPELKPDRCSGKREVRPVERAGPKVGMGPAD